jgi:hypothetical protein
MFDLFARKNISNFIRLGECDEKNHSDLWNSI